MQIKYFIGHMLLLTFIFSFACTSFAEAPSANASGQSQIQVKTVMSPLIDQGTIPLKTMSPTDSAWIMAMLDRYINTVLLILFGALVIFAQYKYLALVKPDPDVSLPAFSLTLIITGTLVLVSISPNTQVLGTVVGLFGTIAGYVLGRSTPKKQGITPTPTPQQVDPQ